MLVIMFFLYILADSFFKQFINRISEENILLTLFIHFFVKKVTFTQTTAALRYKLIPKYS